MTSLGTGIAPAKPHKVLMFNKSSSEGYRKMLDGVELKAPVHGERTMLTTVRFVKGAVVPVHQHPHEQTGYLVSGSLRFIIGDEVFDARPGDSWNIASGVSHGAEALEDTVVIEVFSPIREDYLP
ncbi:MAG: cupin domain-containing protein [bacterium]